MHRGFAAPEGGQAKGFQKFVLLVGIGGAFEDVAEDVAAHDFGFVFAEDLETAGESEFGGEAAHDVGEEGVEGAQEEAGHALDEEDEELLVVALLEFFELSVEGVLDLVGFACELAGGVFGGSAFGELLEDFVEEFSGGLAGKGDCENGFGAWFFAGQEVAAHDRDVAVGELPGLAGAGRRENHFVVHERAFSLRWEKLMAVRGSPKRRSAKLS